MPFLAFETFIYQRFCTSQSAERPWCSEGLGMSYGWVQREYWCATHIIHPPENATDMLFRTGIRASCDTGRRCSFRTFCWPLRSSHYALRHRTRSTSQTPKRRGAEPFPSLPCPVDYECGANRTRRRRKSRPARPSLDLQRLTRPSLSSPLYTCRLLSRLCSSSPTTFKSSCASASRIQSRSGTPPSSSCATGIGNGRNRTEAAGGGGGRSGRDIVGSGGRRASCSGQCSCHRLEGV